MLSFLVHVVPASPKVKSDSNSILAKLFGFLEIHLKEVQGGGADHYSVTNSPMAIRFLKWLAKFLFGEFIGECLDKPPLERGLNDCIFP